MTEVLTHDVTCHDAQKLIRAHRILDALGYNGGIINGSVTFSASTYLRRYEDEVMAWKGDREISGGFVGLVVAEARAVTGRHLGGFPPKCGCPQRQVLTDDGFPRWVPETLLESCPLAVHALEAAHREHGCWGA